MVGQEVAAIVSWRVLAAVARHWHASLVPGLLCTCLCTEAGEAGFLSCGCRISHTVLVPGKPDHYKIDLIKSRML